ncbi:DinB family protein [Polluticaenibacter yanchengensis]|uniref:DinB family protein n=1 Tax=Polluticaenibacter yanchengensis TaxID=3014562 RepID=A0ABT4UKM4_9BACT|nr:DinB family protein [Chitinophagaceae bacterium LY-5]
MRPVPGDYASFYEGYINLVENDSANAALQDSLFYLENFLNEIPENKAEYRYEDGKWSVLQVIQHLIDTERIMCYRALCIARGEKVELPGFDETEYANLAEVSHRSLKSLFFELNLVRKSTLHLFHSFTNDMLARRGVANHYEVTVNALAFIIVGHTQHHINILKTKYL